MNWTNKFILLLEEALNKDCSIDLYEVDITFDTSTIAKWIIVIERGGQQIYKRETIEHLPSHWMAQARDLFSCIKLQQFDHIASKID